MPPSSGFFGFGACCAADDIDDTLPPTPLRTSTADRPTPKTKKAPPTPLRNERKDDGGSGSNDGGGIDTLPDPPALTPAAPGPTPPATPAPSAIESPAAEKSPAEDRPLPSVPAPAAADLAGAKHTGWVPARPPRLNTPQPAAGPPGADTCAGGLWEGPGRGESCEPAVSGVGGGETPSQFDARKAEAIRSMQARKATRAEAQPKKPMAKAKAKATAKAVAKKSPAAAPQSSKAASADRPQVAVVGGVDGGERRPALLPA